MRINSLFLFAFLMMGNLIPQSSLALSNQLGQTDRIKASVVALALLYPNMFLHELGHKYAAKFLTGADSTIELGIISGVTRFDDANWKILKKNPKSAILTLLADPVVGFLGGLCTYAAASLLDKNSFLHHGLKTGGVSQMIGNLANLVPFYWSNPPSDGYQIWQTYDEMKNGNPEKEKVEKLEDLSQKATEQFSSLKKQLKKSQLDNKNR